MHSMLPALFTCRNQARLARQLLLEAEPLWAKSFTKEDSESPGRNEAMLPIPRPESRTFPNATDDKLREPFRANGYGRRIEGGSARGCLVTPKYEVCDDQGSWMDAFIAFVHTGHTPLGPGTQAANPG